MYTKIKNKAILNIKKDFIVEDPGKFKKLNAEIRKREKGIFFPDKDGKMYDSLSDIEKIILESQVEIFVSIKYNFIHYKPLPKSQNLKIDYLKNLKMNLIRMMIYC